MNRLNNVQALQDKLSHAAKQSLDRRFGALYDKLYRRDVLEGAWRRVRANKGAPGIDEQSFEYIEEEIGIEAFLDEIERELKAKTYRPLPVKRCWIEKPGKPEKRPLGIPVIKDRLVQMAAKLVMEPIFETNFLPCSYGFRPERDAPMAIREIQRIITFQGRTVVVDADIRSYFDHMDHDWILKMLEHRIDDQAFLGLIRKWLKAGILETDGTVIHPETGTPQGGIVSPVLANLYLHYALDLWFDRTVRSHSRGKAALIRYADDWVCAFQDEADAHRFYRTLPKRLKKFSLEVAEEKTNCLLFSPTRLGTGKRFHFLGFEFYWDRDRKGLPRVKRRTVPKRLQGACRRIKTWIKDHRHLPKAEFVSGLNRRLTGHYHYYGIIGNGYSINRFYRWAMDCTFNWLNRRGGKRKSFTWDVFWRAVNRGLFRPPRIVVGVKR